VANKPPDKWIFSSQTVAFVINSSYQAKKFWKCSLTNSSLIFTVDSV
jgi:hypothetical protein